MAKDEKTSESVASKAAKLLADPSTPPDVKSVAASALTQAPDKKRNRLERRQGGGSSGTDRHGSRHIPVKLSALRLIHLRS